MGAMAYWHFLLAFCVLLICRTLGNREGRAVTDFYNYRDEMAQAVCVSMTTTGGIFAVRRQCDSGQPSCADICISVGKNCFGGQHVYDSNRRLSPDPREDIGTVGLKIYRYNDCSTLGCGPNYCCCKN